MQMVDRGFITSQGAPDIGNLQQTMKELTNSLDNYILQDTLQGYLVKLLYSAKAIDNMMLNQDEILSLSNDKLPVVYIGISYDSTKDLSELLTKLGTRFALRLLESISRQ